MSVVISPGMLRLSEEPVRKILRNIGLTEKEIEVYIFLAKHGALKGAEIAKLTSTDNAEVYRILRSLQNKGLIEATLESPTRFLTIPFDRVLDSFIRGKRNEVALVENAKEDLLSDWERISKAMPALSVEKFVVIEGEDKIHAKILQIVKETKNQLLVVSTVAGLLQADRFGFFNAINEHPLKSKIQIRFAAELSEKNLGIMKTLLTRMPKIGANFNVRSPVLGLRSCPRMLIKDDEEILLFITPTKEPVLTTEENEVGLFTNSKMLVQSFSGVFAGVWENSVEIEKRMLEIETGKPGARTFVINDPKAAQKAYQGAVKSSKEDIVIMTSSEWLIACRNEMQMLKESSREGVRVRIMAPITGENLKTALELSEYFEIGHVPASYLTTTVIDGRHLFQFKNPSLKAETPEAESLFANTYYTSDNEHVERVKTMLDDVWRNAQTPSAALAESVINASEQKTDLITDKRYSEYSKSWNITSLKFGEATEKDIINKIIDAKKNPPRRAFRRHTDVFYGCAATAVVHPPESFNLPRMIIQVGHFDKQSSFGEHDEITISSWLDTGKGCVYVPVAQICDNARILAHRKQLFAGKPIAHNLQLVRKNELQVRLHGNTLFAGWTVPIALFPPPSTLPPCAILFEGYGELKTRVMETKQAGRRQIYESNTFEAFVSFFHPSSKYSGPGTDGLLSRDLIITSSPLESSPQRLSEAR